jgi:beta-glucosidase
MKKLLFPFLVLAWTCLVVPVQAQPPRKFMYQDTSLPMEDRVNFLVSQMTIQEKIGQMVYTAPTIERLGVPAYNCQTGQTGHLPGFDILVTQHQYFPRSKMGQGT